ncbi:hypothetical protein RMN56_28190 [Micromonospora halotolerans]|uniref:Uncharacterized protein n=1 Tax=Micromonospora halotolerans TaxID=709879 RepID=A0ABY9ZWL7_9ACTN|nr:hypothetical protein [Micromonospora halotolerans]WNM38970.1 hypothetical protein RMN56_28190 [Micromonospora halotolerans]
MTGERQRPTRADLSMSGRSRRLRVSRRRSGNLVAHHGTERDVEAWEVVLADEPESEPATP